MNQIIMTRDFTNNGKLYKKGQILKIHGRFKKGDIDPIWAGALIERGVAKPHEPKPANNKPVKK